MVEEDCKTEVLTVRQLESSTHAFSLKLTVAKLEHYVDDEISLNLPFGVVASYQWQKIGKGKTAFEHRAKKQRQAASQSPVTSQPASPEQETNPERPPANTSPGSHSGNKPSRVSQKKRRGKGSPSREGIASGSVRLVSHKELLQEVISLRKEKDILQQKLALSDNHQTASPPGLPTQGSPPAPVFPLPGAEVENLIHTHTEDTTETETQSCAPETPQFTRFSSSLENDGTPREDGAKRQ